MTEWERERYQTAGGRWWEEESLSLSQDTLLYGLGARVCGMVISCVNAQAARLHFCSSYAAVN